MQINLDYNTEAYTIRSYTPTQIVVSIPGRMVNMDENNERYQDLFAERKIPTIVCTTSVIITPDTLIENWAPTSVADLSAEHFATLADFQPEVILLGTGNRIQFPSPAITLPLLKQRIGVEVMDTAAACRTYNFLTADGRRVVAALMIS